MSKAVKSLWDISQDDVMREVKEALDKRRRDQATLKEDAFQRGEQRGIVKGRAEERKKIARDMLEAGADPEFITKITGLTLEEVKALQ